MNNIQIKLINKIVKESKKIESLKKELEQLQKDYYSDILKLYDSVDILGKEKEVAKTEIISMQDYKAKRIFRKQR